MDDDLIDELKSLPGEAPGVSFRRRLLLDIDLAADEYDEAATLTERTDGTNDRADDSLDDARGSRRRGHFPLLAAAAVLLLVVGAWQVLDRGSEDDLQAGDADVGALLDAASAPQAQPQDRLELLVEAARLRPSAEVVRALGQELRDQGLLRIAAREFDGISDFTISPDGSTLLVVSEAAGGPDAVTWSIGDDEVMPLTFGVQPLFAAGFLSTGQVRVTPETLRPHVVGLDDPDAVLPGVPLATNRLDVSPAVGRLDGELVMFDAETGDVQTRVTVPRLLAAPVRVAPGGTLVVASRQPSSAEPDRLVVWDPADPVIRTDHPLLDLAISDSAGVAFSADGRTMAVALSDRVAVLDGTTFQEVRSIPVPSATRLDFVGSGATLVVQYPDRFSVWDAAVGAPLLDDVSTSEPDLLSAADPPTRIAPIAGLIVVLGSSTDDLAEVWVVDPEAWIAIARSAVE